MLLLLLFALLVIKQQQEQLEALVQDLEKIIFLDVHARHINNQEMELGIVKLI